MYRLEVCLGLFVHAEVACRCVRMKTERLGPLQASKQNECLKQQLGEEGRRAGAGEGKTYPCTVEDGPGRWLSPSFNSDRTL